MGISVERVRDCWESVRANRWERYWSAKWLFVELLLPCYKAILTFFGVGVGVWQGKSHSSCYHHQCHHCRCQCHCQCRPLPPAGGDDFESARASNPSPRRSSDSSDPEQPGRAGGIRWAPAPGAQGLGSRALVTRGSLRGRVWGSSMVPRPDRSGTSAGHCSTPMNWDCETCCWFF